RASSQTRVDVRVVDSDVHPVPRIGELTEYIPEPYRSKYWARRRVGETNTYDAPDYYRAQAMRLDSFPEDGNFPGSVTELAFRGSFRGPGGGRGRRSGRASGAAHRGAHRVHPRAVPQQVLGPAPGR